MRHKIDIFFTLLISFGLLAFSGYRHVDSSKEPSLRIISSDNNGIRFEVTMFDYDIGSQTIGARSYQTINVQNYSYISDAGKPQLPMTSVLIGAPPESNVSLDVIDDQSSTIREKFDILPNPRPAPWNGDPDQLDWSYIPDEAIYLTNETYPTQPVKIVEDGWLRDQRIIKVEIYPFQYRPTDKVVIWHNRLIVEVKFNGVDPENAFHTSSNQTNNGNPFDSVLDSELLNYDVARNWRSMPTSSDGYQSFVEGTRVKIDIDHDGLYQITYDDLVPTGLLDFNPQTYHMTSQGEDVAIWVIGEEDGSFDQEDLILFYGQRFHGDTLAQRYSDENSNWITYTQQLSDGSSVLWHPQVTADMFEKYTNQNVYWLQGGVDTNPPRMGTIDGTPGSAPLVSTFRMIQRAENQLRRWEYHFTNEETWFWQFVTDTQTYVYSTTLNSISTQPLSATVSGEVVAFTYDDYDSPDHHTVFRINNRTTPLDDAYWDGKSRYHFEAQIPSTDLLEGTNQLYFQIVDDAASSPQIMFDWFEIAYERMLIAKNDQLLYSGDQPGTWKYQVDGFNSPDIQAYDIASPRNPIRILNLEEFSNAGGYSAIFQVNHQINEKFFMLSVDAYQTPKSITLYTPPDLRSPDNGADYIIIAHPDFLSTAQTLADFRTQQGLRSMVINIEDIYNEFNEGIYHPIAIKSFLEYTFSNWTPPAPSYVVIIGDGNWNMRGYNPAGYGNAPIFMPPILGWVDPWQGEVDSINLLATIVGNDPLPDVMISRIPINSSVALESVIQKIIYYEQMPIAEWQRNILFIADNIPDPAGDFIAMAEGIIADYIEPGFSPIRIYENDYIDSNRCGTPPYIGGPTCPNVNHAITETLDYTGTLITNYIGHASVRNWAREQIFLYHPDDPNNPNDQYYSDFDTLWNSNQLPIVLSMTCLDGYWFHPTLQPSLAELFLRTSTGGAVATFSPTGLGVATGHDALQRGFYQSIFHDGNWNFGLATYAAKFNLYQSSNNFDLLQTFTIFGDPAIRIPNPYGLSLSPLEASQSGVVDTDITYSLQLTNTGVITDEFELIIEGNQWETTIPYTRTSLTANQSIEITTTVHIPPDVPGGAIDDTILHVISTGNRDKQAAAHISTTANVFGLIVRPAEDTKINLPGETVTYTLQVTNTSNTSDTFDIAMGNHNWITELGQNQIGPLPSYQGEILTVTVNIPDIVNDWEADSVVISFTSQSDPSRIAISTLETIARTYGISLTPPFQYGSGVPGAVISYTLSVKNEGGYLDSILITAFSDNGWIVTPDQQLIGPLEPNQTAIVDLAVQIPLDIPGGTVDSVTVQAVSQSDENITATSYLYTTANVYGFILSPLSDSSVSNPGQTITHTLQITNLANVADIFDVFIGNHNWFTTASQMEILLGAGGTATLYIYVTTPNFAWPYDSDNVTITLISRGDETKINLALLTTIIGGIYLPIISK
jgi:Peptidase family C25/Propeptide_C25